MNFQEKYNEYKQRQEAKRFFNQNNDYHLSTIDYAKMIIVGTLIAIFSTIVFDLISIQIGWNFSVFNILIGYFTGYIVLKIARYGSEKVGIISVACYVLGTTFAPVLIYCIFLRQPISLMLVSQVAFSRLKDIFSLLFIVIGAMSAYTTGKN